MFVYTKQDNIIYRTSPDVCRLQGAGGDVGSRTVLSVGCWVGGGGRGLRKPHQSVLRCELMSSSLPLIEIEDKFNQRIIRPLCGSNDPARFLSGILIPADFPRIEFGLNSPPPLLTTRATNRGRPDGCPFRLRKGRHQIISWALGMIVRIEIVG